MPGAESLDPTLRSTYELIRRAYPDGVPDDEYFPLLAVFEETDISARGLGQVLEAIDGRPYAEHYYLFLHVLPSRRPSASQTAAVREKLERAGFSRWIEEES